MKFKSSPACSVEIVAMTLAALCTQTTARLVSSNTMCRITFRSLLMASVQQLCPPSCQATRVSFLLSELLGGNCSSKRKQLSLHFRKFLCCSSLPSRWRALRSLWTLQTPPLGASRCHQPTVESSGPAASVVPQSSDDQRTAERRLFHLQ